MCAPPTASSTSAAPFSAPAADPEAGWPSADEEAAVAAIAGANGIELLGPPGALPLAS